MEKTLPKTAEIREKSYGVFDIHSLLAKRTSLENEILEKEERLTYCESVEEHREISEEIRVLKQKNGEVEVEIRINPKKQEQFLNTELKQLPEIYNEEFKPHYNRYKKLDKELKNKLQKLTKEIEPIVIEMNEIERLEGSFHLLKNKVKTGRSEFIKLPVSGSDTNGQSLKAPYNFHATRDSTLASEVNTLIKQIKKLK